MMNKLIMIVLIGLFLGIIVALVLYKPLGVIAAIIAVGWWYFIYKR